MSQYFQVYSADWTELTAFFAGERPEAMEDFEDVFFEEYDSDMLEDDEEEDLSAGIKRIFEEGIPSDFVRGDADDNGMRFGMFELLAEVEEGTGIDDEVVEEPVDVDAARELFGLIESHSKTGIGQELADPPRGSIRFVSPQETVELSKALRTAEKAGKLELFLKDENRREELFEPLVEAGEEGRGLLLIIE